MPFKDLSKLRAAILDMDGVVWRGSEPIGDLPGIFTGFRQAGWKVSMATNNATRSPEQYRARLLTYGVEVETSQIVNSAQAMAHMLKERFPQGGAVYIVGEEGLVSILAEAGFIQGEQGCLAVVAAMDRQLTYEKLRVATLLIRAGVPFFATNPDRTFPTPDGLVPGAVSIRAALEAATDVKAIIAGKPSPEMYKVAMERMGTDPSETLIVGDRLETDIAGGQALGCPTALVLSGVTSPEQARLWNPPPDWIVDDLNALVKSILQEEM